MSRLDVSVHLSQLKVLVEHSIGLKLLSHISGYSIRMNADQVSACGAVLKFNCMSQCLSAAHTCSCVAAIHAVKVKSQVPSCIATDSIDTNIKGANFSS